MSLPLVITHYYQSPPDKVWRVATYFQCFTEAMHGVATFEGMPATGHLEQGQVFDVKVRLFGKLPPMDYHMEILECDHEAFQFLSVERGGSVKRWVHQLTVTPNGTGARLTDCVTVNAGLSTPLMRLWARYVYAKRHAPRLRMLGEV